jgi:cephalosporin hydroxylase
MNDRNAEVFHRRYYGSRVWHHDTHWLGVETQKCPLDLWIYQEILFELQPDLIIETGTAEGGSALYLASICDLLEHGNVVTIDLKESARRHGRVTYLTGSSTDKEIVERVQMIATRAETIMVILDSDHSSEHVLTELAAYAPLVSHGSYLIVEDTNLNGHPVVPEHGPGPAEAVQIFLSHYGTEWEVDRTREKFRLTFNPGGYLRRR